MDKLSTMASVNAQTELKKVEFESKRIEQQMQLEERRLALQEKQVYNWMLSKFLFIINNLLMPTF